MFAPSRDSSGLRTQPDGQLHATLHVGHALPTIAQASIVVHLARHRRTVRRRLGCSAPPPALSAGTPSPAGPPMRAPDVQGAVAGSIDAVIAAQSPSMRGDGRRSKRCRPAPSRARSPPSRPRKADRTPIRACRRARRRRHERGHDTAAAAGPQFLQHRSLLVVRACS
jgi:hypothetical protein